MRRFIVEAVVDAVLLLIIILVLGVINVAQPFPFGTGSAPIVELRGAGPIGFLSWAAILVLVNRFARPVLVAFTGRLLFATMGFFIVIINAIAIYITSIIAPIKIADVAQPVLLWVIVAAALYTLLSTARDAVLGINRPDLQADRSRGIWGFLERLPTPRRNAIIENLRLQQVYNAIYTTTLDIALADTPIGSIRRWFARVVLGDRLVIDDPGGPARIRLMLQQLGPTYVKIGQMAASRSDVLSPEWITELSKLQSEAAPFAYDDVVIIVTQGARLDRPRSYTRRSTRSRSRRRRRRRSTRRRCMTGRSSRSRSSGRGSRPRRRPIWASWRSWRRSPSAACRWPARSVSGASSTSSQRASSRSSTTATRPTTRAASRTA